MNIKNLSLYAFLVFALSFGGNLAAELASAKVTKVVGNVMKTTASGDSTPLTKGMILKEGDGIETTQLSTAELIFSNGSELTVEENTSVKIETLQQEAFSGDKTYGQLKADPSNSETLLALNYGSLDGHVKKLREESNFEIDTAFGTASIRGTRWRVSIAVLPNGAIVVNVINKDGVVNYAPKSTPSEPGSSQGQGRDASIIEQVTTDQPKQIVLRPNAGEGSVEANLYDQVANIIEQVTGETIEQIIATRGMSSVVTPGGIGVEVEQDDDSDDLGIIVVSPDGPATED